MFEVIEGGLQTTVQDSGRLKYQAIGIPPSGAFDNFSLRIGNLLVGNKVGGSFLVSDDHGEAGLEITLIGPKLRVLKETIIAIVGADLSSTLNGEPVSRWKTERVMEGDIIAFGACKSGCRAYICVSGGIDVPLYLRSKSTYVKGSIGGFDGRPLKKGDIIETGNPSMPLNEQEGREIRSDVIPNYGNEQEIRVVLGPQDYLFTDDGLELFLKEQWKVSFKADRIGYRYIGPKLELKPLPEYLIKWVGKDPSNIVDDPTVPGSIQWCSTELILLGVDSITLGGFAKPATVISTDISKVGQSKPGDVHRFKAVTASKALHILEEVESKISEDNVILR